MSSKTLRNRKHKFKQKQRKGKLKDVLALARKDQELEQMKKCLENLKKKIPMKTGFKLPKVPRQILINKPKSTLSINAKATSGRTATNIIGARKTIINTLSSIPTFETESVFFLTDQNCEIPHGRFGQVKLGKIKKMDIIVAVKVFINKNSHAAIIAETIVGMTLSGSDHFPYVYGLWGDNILMQYFGEWDDNKSHPSPNLAAAIKNKMMPAHLKGLEMQLVKKSTIYTYTSQPIFNFYFYPNPQSCYSPITIFVYTLSSFSVLTCFYFIYIYIYLI